MAAEPAAPRAIPLGARLSVALAVLYPLLSHFAATRHSPMLQTLALTVVMAVPLAPALLLRRAWAFAGLAIAVALAYALAHGGLGQWGLYLPPVLLPGALSLTFALSLRRGQVPLISAIADAARGPLTPELWRYTRRLTAFWAALTASLVVITLTLSVVGPIWLWSVFSNGVSYLIVGVVFVGEFYLRHRWFPEHDHPGFWEYLGIVMRGPPRNPKP